MLTLYSMTFANLPKNSVNFCIKTEPVTVGASATVFAWFMCHICDCQQKPDIQYTVASASAVTGSVFMRRFNCCCFLAERVWEQKWKVYKNWTGLICKDKIYSASFWVYAYNDIVIHPPSDQKKSPYSCVILRSEHGDMQKACKNLANKLRTL